MEYKNPIDLPAWSRLEELAKSETLNMKEEFSRDKERVKKYSLDVKLSEEHGLHVDYSKNLINDTIWRTLQQLVLESDLEGHRKAMFDGAHINDTEDRAVLHTALRASPMGVSTLPRTVREPVAVELQKMREFCEALHSGTWTGWTGKRISDVVNIGIGGSDLGPRMAVEALQGYVQSESPRVHFVSNVDALDLAAVLQQCPPDSTLFIIVSKTFTTLETMTNATAAKAWFLRHSEQVSFPFYICLIHRPFVIFGPSFVLCLLFFVGRQGKLTEGACICRRATLGSTLLPCRQMRQPYGPLASRMMDVTCFPFGTLWVDGTACGRPSDWPLPHESAWTASCSC